jgi:hypothetical protein
MIYLLDISRKFSIILPPDLKGQINQQGGIANEQRGSGQSSG